MRARPRVPVAVPLIAALMTLALALPVGASARVPQGFVGMVLAPPVFPADNSSIDLGQQLGTMVSSGVENVRAVFNWSYAQPYNSWTQVPFDEAADFTNVGGIPTRFGQMDQLVGLAAEKHLTVMPVILYAPGWDSSSHPPTSFAQPASPGPFANFVAALVQRYGPHGTFWQTHSPKIPVRSWQIWNEPNVTVFWPHQPFERAYVKLLRAAHSAIKRLDHGAKVVLAGMPNYSWRNLAKIYKIHGARKLFDVVAVHPYTRQPQGVVEILQKVRQVMNAAGDRRKPIIADEISWPSSQGKTRHTDGFDFATTPRGQARNLSSLLPLLARARGQLHLLGFDYYTWAGTEARGGNAFDFAGLFRFASGKLVSKPAFSAFGRAALKLENCRQKGSIATACAKRG